MPPSEAFNVSQTDGFLARLRSFWAPRPLKTTTAGSSHENHTGTLRGAPVGVTVANQITGSIARRACM